MMSVNLNQEGIIHIFCFTHFANCCVVYTRWINSLRYSRSSLSRTGFAKAITKFRTWVYSVAKNHCLQQLRKTKREIVTDFNHDLIESTDILHLLEKETDEERLKAPEDCLEKLLENQPISIRQFFMEEMSYADIADKTGFDLKQIKSYIQNRKRNLSICIGKLLK